MVYQKPRSGAASMSDARSACWWSTTRRSCARPLTRMLDGAPDIEVVGIGRATARTAWQGRARAAAGRGDARRPDAAAGRPRGARRHHGREPGAGAAAVVAHQEGADVTLRGLELGAMDFVDKSSVQGHMNLLSLAEELLAKMRALGQRAARGRSRPAPRPGGAGPVARRRRGAGAWRSAPRPAGPPRCRRSSPRCPRASPRRVLVVQHMPRGLHALARRAARLAQRAARARGAGRRAVLQPGRVLIAPAGQPH